MHTIAPAVQRVRRLSTCCVPNGDIVIERMSRPLDVQPHIGLVINLGWKKHALKARRFGQAE